MGVVRVAVVLLLAWVAAGCGPRPAVEAEPMTNRYDGPLHVASGRAGAAGRVVECATPTTGGREEEPYVGESGASTHAALENLFMTELLSWPLDAFHVERSEPTGCSTRCGPTGTRGWRRSCTSAGPRTGGAGSSSPGPAATSPSCRAR